MAEQGEPDAGKQKKTIIAAVCLVLAGAMLWYNFWPETKFSTERALFSDDDGKTWYEDSIENIPPYTHNGKEAVRINVYRTAKNSTPFAGFLTKFPADVKADIEARAKQNKQPAHRIAYAGETPNRMLAKPPENKNLSWEPVTSPAGIKAMTVKSPDGTELDSVLPTE